MLGAQERVLITGASGFIGGALARHIGGLGLPVACIARSAMAAIGPTVESHSCDINDMPRLARVVRDFAPTLCFHLAASPDAAESHAQSEAVLRTNLMGTLNVLESVRLSGNCRVVYGCSVKVYGNGPVPYHPGQPVQPNSSYAVSKAAGREMLDLYRRLYDVPVAALRPTLVFGPGQGWNIVSYVAARIKARDKAINLMGGSQTRSPLFIDDTVSAFCQLALALGHCSVVNGSAIPIDGGEELRIVDLVDRMSALAGHEMKPVLVEQATRPTEIFRSAADNSHARALIRWQPAWSLDAALARTMQHLGVGLVQGRSAQAGVR